MLWELFNTVITITYLNSAETTALDVSFWGIDMMKKHMS